MMLIPWRTPLTEDSRTTDLGHFDFRAAEG